MRVPDGRIGGGGAAPGGAFEPRRQTSSNGRPSRACAWICTRRSIRATARSPSVSTTSGSSGIEWSPHPTEEEARREYERIWPQLGSRTIEELIDLPLMTDPASLGDAGRADQAHVGRLRLRTRTCLPWSCADAVNLSLEHGNCDASCFAYVWLGMIAGPRFGDYRTRHFASASSATTWSSNAG